MQMDHEGKTIEDKVQSEFRARIIKGIDFALELSSCQNVVALSISGERVIVPNAWCCFDNRDHPQYMVQINSFHTGHVLMVSGELCEPTIFHIHEQRPLRWVQSNIDDIDTILNYSTSAVKPGHVNFLELAPDWQPRDIKSYAVLKHWVKNTPLPVVEAFPPYGIEFPYEKSQKNEDPSIADSQHLAFLGKAYIAVRQELARRGVALGLLFEQDPQRVKEAIEDANKKLAELVSDERPLPAHALPGELLRTPMPTDAYKDPKLAKESSVTELLEKDDHV